MVEGMIWYFAMLNALALCYSYLLFSLYIRYASVHKILAIPNARSSHSIAMPTGAGMIFALNQLVFLFLAIYGIKNQLIINSIFKMFIGIIFVITLGILDDKYSLRAKHKLLIQIAIALLMTLLNFRITTLTNPFGEPIILNYLSVPLTVGWYVIVMNAINLIDGLDGLAAGITIISCLVLICYSFYAHNFFVFINCNFLVISLIAFLFFNFHPAKVFMGDSGSLFIGFLLASLAIAGNEAQFKGLTTFTLLVPITLIFIPLSDTVFTIFRRFINKQPIFRADKNHFHHKLISLGLSNRAVTLLCWFITFIFGIIALGYMFIPKNVMMLILLTVSLSLLGLFVYLYKKELFK
ncbi:MAG: undecaprenyl/decaprenyl-phosphate alpha-N-acetylglucosaminyl 1-phosphate transferase [Candidatus Cloacimonetes bacterium]|nr:undecaprenyl/decaprenyl-phosphate alpha-N-acetylglucosaminyl 1-phosphate transferase [Candidatus Cloacimonadota bacterium]